MTVAAVVVTFNRKELLRECLDGLLGQSLSLDAIYIVDNASSDGTELYLRENGYLARECIHYLRLPENGGGAGGFYQGLRAAFQAGYDWIWLMDDDTEPEPDALNHMVPLTAHEEIVAIANEKLDRLRRKTLDGLRMLRKQDPALAYPQVRFSSFVGLLIRSTAVRQIGLPRPEFFIHNDDLEYCMRLRKVGHIALAIGSRVVHKEQDRQIAPKQLFGLSYLPKGIHAYAFEYYGLRNFVFSHRTHSSTLQALLVVWRRYLRFAGAILLFDRTDRYLRFKVLSRAYLDGYLGNFDNGFPIRFREKLKKLRDHKESQ